MPVAKTTRACFLPAAGITRWVSIARQFTLDIGTLTSIIRIVESNFAIPKSFRREKTRNNVRGRRASGREMVTAVETTGDAASQAINSGVGLSPDTIRRAALRLMPFLLLCYFISFLDRINVAFAALQMNKAIGLTTAQYGFGAGLFFLTYCLFEVPSNLMLFRVGATRWIARIMLVWGPLCRRHGVRCRSLQFLRMRLLLGAAEAGFFPGVLFFPYAVVSHGLSRSHCQRVHGRGRDQRVVRRAGFGSALVAGKLSPWDAGLAVAVYHRRRARGITACRVSTICRTVRARAMVGTG